jgi:hypothetical protein
MAHVNFFIIISSILLSIVHEGRTGSINPTCSSGWDAADQFAAEDKYYSPNGGFVIEYIKSHKYSKYGLKSLQLYSSPFSNLISKIAYYDKDHWAVVFSAVNLSNSSDVIYFRIEFGCGLCAGFDTTLLKLKRSTETISDPIIQKFPYLENENYKERPITKFAKWLTYAHWSDSDYFLAIFGKNCQYFARCVYRSWSNNYNSLDESCERWWNYKTEL